MAAQKDSLPRATLRWFQSLRDRLRTAPSEPSASAAPAGRTPEPDPSPVDPVDHDLDAPEEGFSRGIGETRGGDPNEGK